MKTFRVLESLQQATAAMRMSGMQAMAASAQTEPAAAQPQENTDTKKKNMAQLKSMDNRGRHMVMNSMAPNGQPKALASPASAPSTNPGEGASTESSGADSSGDNAHQVKDGKLAKFSQISKAVGGAAGTGAAAVTLYDIGATASVVGAPTLVAGVPLALGLTGASIVTNVVGEIAEKVNEYRSKHPVQAAMQDQGMHPLEKKKPSVTEEVKDKDLMAAFKNDKPETKPEVKSESAKEKAETPPPSLASSRPRTGASPSALPA